MDLSNIPQDHNSSEPFSSSSMHSADIKSARRLEKSGVTDEYDLQPPVLVHELEKQSGRCPPDIHEDPYLRVVSVQDWNGPDDPGNPYNWSIYKRAYHVLVPGLMCFTITFGSSVYTPAYPELARKFNVSGTVSLLGGLSLPFIGGFAAQYKGWRWTQWTILFIGVACYAISLPMHETYKKIILKQRAQKENVSLPPSTSPTRAAALKFLITVTLLRPLHMLVTEPIVTFFSLYTAFAFAVLFTFFAAFPFVFSGYYSFTPSQTGLVFLAVGLGVLLAAASAIFFDIHLYRRHAHSALATGRFMAEPEHRLYAAMAGSFGIPVGLFWFAWTAEAHVHPAALIVAAVPFGWGNLSLFISAALYLVDVYGPLNGASALAANGVLRYSMGAAFPLFTVQVYEKLGIGWATSLLGFVSLGLLPIPWVLFRWGAKIRAKSQYETVKA
ncbi:MFS general substrate transporter [Patellaria atrata CBS 101060]|uniref:MFS general substrate transporter n=1 Tax=Patellaria atrata CBS 101060 TaxID=1346257 RepID=A0A9P4SGG7_9PEZI|nr:MFS general substrate transporter [Patellaria atrata CBS 101060]